MWRIMLLALMLLGVGSETSRAEGVSYPSENVQKIVLVLNSVGFYGDDVKEFVVYVDEHSEDGYWKFVDEEMAGGKLSLQYEMDMKISIDQMQLKYAPENSNFVYTARPNVLMMNYKMSF